jgi:NAD(P)-dependent dehydrogenase (short-subunit alcohol dehydrogenase family)
MLSKIEKPYGGTSNQGKNYQVTYNHNGQNLRGKAVVIIGDAAGVGLETAVLLAEQGAPVFLAARTIAELKHALAAINQSGGEGDGMVVDVSREDECRRFFILAEGWLGRIDAVINPLFGAEWVDAQSPEMNVRNLKSAHSKSVTGEMAIARQNLCTQEAIQRMQPRGFGHIININLAGYQRSGNSPEQRAAVELRRQASEHGIRVTLIEPGGGARAGQIASDVLHAKDIARCVIDSLSQPFGVDMVVLPGKLQIHPV